MLGSAVERIVGGIGRVVGRGVGVRFHGVLDVGVVLDVDKRGRHAGRDVLRPQVEFAHVLGGDHDARNGRAALPVKMHCFDAFERHDTGHTETVMTEETTIWDVFQPQLIKGPTERNKFREVDQAQMQARGF